MIIKRALGIILMIFSVMLISIILLSMIMLFTDPELKSWILTTLLGFVFITGFGIFLFIYGRKLYRRKETTPLEERQYLEDHKLDLNVKLEASEYIELVFIEAYRNPIIIFMTCIGFLLMCTVVDFLTINSMAQESFPVLQMIFGAFFLFFMPFSTYIHAKKNLTSNQLIRERIEYMFDPSEIKVKGESFDLNMKWTAIISVKELRKWYILYTESNRGYLIPKRTFSSKDYEDKFKELLLYRTLMK